MSKEIDLQEEIKKNNEVIAKLNSLKQGLEDFSKKGKENLEKFKTTYSKQLEQKIIDEDKFKQEIDKQTNEFKQKMKAAIQEDIERGRSTLQNQGVSKKIKNIKKMI